MYRTVQTGEVEVRNLLTVHVCVSIGTCISVYNVSVYIIYVSVYNTLASVWCALVHYGPDSKAVNYWRGQISLTSMLVSNLNAFVEAEELFAFAGRTLVWNAVCRQGIRGYVQHTTSHTTVGHTSSCVIDAHAWHCLESRLALPPGEVQNAPFSEADIAVRRTRNGFLRNLGRGVISRV